MKLFINKLIFFIIFLTIIMILADNFISTNLKKSNKYSGEFEVWNDLYNSKINSELLIYGSSRAWVQIDPFILEDCLNLTTYNLGIDGHNFNLQYLRHLEYLKNNIPPKIIILSVDIFTLHQHENLYNYAQFLPYMLWNGNIKKFTSKYNGFTFIDYNIPLLRYRGKTGIMKTSFHLYKEGKIAKLRNKGFKGMKKSWNEDFFKAKLKKKNYSISIDPKIVTLLEQFLIKCAEKEIKIIFIYSPEFIEGQSFVTNRNEIIDIYTKMAKKYNIDFLNYSSDSICLQKNFFYNSTHLNKIGSQIFSQKLCLALENIIEQEI